MKLEGRRTLLLLAAVCALPVLASYFTYYVIQPGKRMNYGQLVEPRPLPAAPLAGLDGKPFALESLRGRWVMVAVDASACDERCRAKLYAMRQVRSAQGKEMDRVERLWLVTDAGTPAPELLSAHDGMRVARGAAALLPALPAEGAPAAHVWVVDPLGNVMMRYPENPDARRMVKDFERLLKYSRIG